MKISDTEIISSEMNSAITLIVISVAAGFVLEDIPAGMFGTVMILSLIRIRQVLDTHNTLLILATLLIFSVSTLLTASRLDQMFQGVSSILMVCVLSFTYSHVPKFCACEYKMKKIYTQIYSARSIAA